MDEIYHEPQFSNEEPYVEYQQAPRKYVNMTFPQPVRNQASACCSQTTNEVMPSMSASKKTKSLKLWKTFAVILMILVVTLVVGVIIVVIKLHQAETNVSGTDQSGQLQRFGDIPNKSCFDLKEQGETRSGYYKIQPDQNEDPLETYCDMTTSGGGWTLVASVHESDVLGSCTINDMWFNSERDQTNRFISRNWENKFTFGSARSATSSDYKNSGYFSIQASDVLVKHFPNNREFDRAEHETLLEYHTENEFLKNYGGNLYSVFSRHYNLTAVPEEKVAYTVNNAEMLDALSASASDIISAIPDFYRYDSSTTTTILGSGNNNIFSSYGMEIYLSSCAGTLSYGLNLNCGNRDILTSSRKTTPFFALTTIGNKQNSLSTFSYRVRSYRYSDDVIRIYRNSLTNGSFVLNYNAYCRYNNVVPSVCDVFYAVSNKKEWQSSQFDFSSSSTSSGIYYLYQYIQNTPKNIVMGYTMLSRKNGLLVSQSQTEDVLRKILAIISRFTSVAKVTCDNSEVHLVQPVKYTVGGAKDVGVPTSLLNEVTPGYMQFRARSLEGIAFAFCPAVRVNTCSSQYLCVGGAGKGSANPNYCSDYPYWSGGSQLNSLDYYNPGSTSRSRQFIESTILIFYR